MTDLSNSASGRPTSTTSRVCRAEWLPHVDAQDEFKAIVAKLSQFGEAIEGAGSVPSTLWMMSDEEGEQLAARIVALADRYLV